MQALGIVVLVLGSGGAGAMLGSALRTWLQRRRDEVTFRVAGPNGQSMVVQARNTKVDTAEIQAILARLLADPGVAESIAVDLRRGDSSSASWRFDQGSRGQNEQSDAIALVITIYLGDETIHEQVEAAVEHLVASVGGQIEHRADPVIGSWFRRMRAKIERSPLAREVAMTAAHAADSHLFLAQDAAITSTMLQNLAPVLTALHPTSDAVIRVGALLIVKVDGVLMVHQLTVEQQLRLDHQPSLAHSPKELLTALELQVSPAQSPNGLDNATNLELHSSSIEDVGPDSDASRRRTS